MKIYLFYLKIKDSDFNSLRHTILLNPYEYIYNEDYNYYIGFYAWTKKKSDIEKFFKIRKKKTHAYLLIQSNTQRQTLWK